jgi:hypothetical protein
VILGLLAAVLASVGYGVATVLQAVGGRRAAGVTAFVQPLVVGGLVLDGVSFAASLVAFDRLPLVVVETIVAASLVVVVLLARRFLGATLRGADRIAVGVVVPALAVLAAGTLAAPVTPGPAWLPTALLVAAGALAAGTAVCWPAAPAWASALASALGYSLVAVAARVVDTDRPLLRLVAQPAVVALLVGGLVGVVGYVRALQRGPVGSAAAIVSVVEVTVPGAVGVALLGDGVRSGWAVPSLLAVAAAVAACVVLARSPANAVAGG